MPSKEEENSHSEVKEEKPANAGLTTLKSLKSLRTLKKSGGLPKDRRILLLPRGVRTGKMQGVEISGKGVYYA